MIEQLVAVPPKFRQRSPLSLMKIGMPAAVLMLPMTPANRDACGIRFCAIRPPPEVFGNGFARIWRGSPDAPVPATDDKLRVLVVDDETHVREVLIEALEADGCEVVSAQSGEIALALYDQHEGKFDAIFTDIGMPEMSGWELVTEIRQRSKTVPIAIISGWADAISVQTKNAVKADWVVAKPFDINKISSIAQEIIQRKTAQALTLKS